MEKVNGVISYNLRKQDSNSNKRCMFVKLPGIRLTGISITRLLDNQQGHFLGRLISGSAFSIMSKNRLFERGENDEWNIFIWA